MDQGYIQGLDLYLAVRFEPSSGALTSEDVELVMRDTRRVLTRLDDRPEWRMLVADLDVGSLAVVFELAGALTASAAALNQLIDLIQRVWNIRVTTELKRLEAQERIAQLRAQHESTLAERDKDFYLSQAETLQDPRKTTEQMRATVAVLSDDERTATELAHENSAGSARLPPPRFTRTYVRAWLLRARLRAGLRIRGIGQRLRRPWSML